MIGGGRAHAVEQARRGWFGGGTVHRVYSVVVFIVLASLDNVAIGLVPALYGPIGKTLDASVGALTVVSSVSFAVSAIAAVGWAYTGDRTNRKPLLMIGTLVWAAGTALTALADSYGAFFAAQLLAAVGLGAVASVGFSVVSDLISPRRRGLVMSFWGLSQGVGTVIGFSLGGLLGRADWRQPFWVLAVAGLIATAAYLFTYDIPRGRSEPELAELFAEGAEYEHRISRADIPKILGRRTNVWLILQGLTAQVTFGSLVLFPLLMQAKVREQGYGEEIAIGVGSVFATLFTVGGALSIVGGLIGDRLQRRTPRGRALVASVGMFAGVPLFVLLFFAPLRVDVPAGVGSGGILTAVLRSVVSEPTVAVAFLVAVLAQALVSANSPNWFALIADVNPPEHRGTVYSLGNLVNGAGRGVGTLLTGYIAAATAASLPPPTNYAVALAVCQFFFIPTGVMYFLASRTSPRDIRQVRELLRERSHAAEAETPA
jgi:MFS family permease